jgi:pyruvate formate lyase activating enzyme
MRCAWCQNPESQDWGLQIMYDATRCRGCGRCLEHCPHAAIRKDERFGLLVDPAACRGCGECCAACYYDARRLVGRSYSVPELMREILKDKRFYDNSGGGVTFSGGEPLLQPDFLAELCRRCREAGVHAAVETCGHVSWEAFAQVLPLLDLLYYDLKQVDPELHRRDTGVDNGLILDNLTAASREFAPLVVRIPVIPGRNDSLDTQRAILEFIAGLPRVESVELLPFHRLGSAKFAGLGREYAFEAVESLKPEDLRDIEALGKSLGLPVCIGTR